MTMEIDTESGSVESAPPKPTRGRGRNQKPGPPRLSARGRERLAAWLFLTPAIAYLLFAFLLPIVYNIMVSFENVTPATLSHFFSPWAGLSNYKFIFNDPTSRQAIVRTLLFTVGSLLGQFIIGFGLALLFTNTFRGRTLARSLIIVPWLVPLIVTGVIFKFLFQYEGGAINQLLMDVGLASHPIDWLDDPQIAFWTILIANIWLGIPFFTMLLYSALQDVPSEIKEAAEIDGAGPWQRLRLVIIPIILPVIEVTFLLGFVFTVKVFDLVIGLTGGGPANATQLITTWSYNLSFQVFNFGQGAAMNNVLLVLAMICAPIYLWLSRDSLRRSSGAGL
jgi:multiple sugar transport system permease protein